MLLFRNFFFSCNHHFEIIPFALLQTMYILLLSWQCAKKKRLWPFMCENFLSKVIFKYINAQTSTVLIKNLKYLIVLRNIFIYFNSYSFWIEHPKYKHQNTQFCQCEFQNLLWLILFPKHAWEITSFNSQLVSKK